MFRTSIGFAAATALIGALAVGPAAAQFAPVSKPVFAERTSAQRAISGGTIVGLTLMRPKGAGKRLTLWVRPLNDFNGIVKVSAVTNDGLYSGSGDFQGSSAARRWVSVTTLTDKGKPAGIRSARADPLFASLAETRPADGRKIILAAWTADGKPPQGSDIAVAFQNLGASARIRLLLPGKQRRDCVTGLGRGASPVFNTVCRLSLAELDQMKTLTVEIIQDATVKQVQRQLL